MAINYTQLATEINTDPKALGYAGKSDYDISVLLNTRGLSSETIFQTYTPSEDLVAGIVLSEYTALQANNRQFVDMVFGRPRVQTGSANLRTQIAAIFAAGTTSRANLVAASQRSASRGEVLFGEGTNVSDLDVAKALRG